METLLMSESLVDSPDVEETVTQVLTKLVQDGEDEDQMSVEFLQEQVELCLEYS
jgi:chorismate mutase